MRVISAVLFVVVLAAMSRSAGAEQQIFRYAFDAGLDVQLHAFSVPEPGASPHILTSSGIERSDAPRKIQVVRAQANGEVSAIDLRSVRSQKPLLVFAATPVHYLVGYQTPEGMNLDLYFHNGQLATKLEAPVPEHVPIAVWPTRHGVVLVANAGRFLIDPRSGKVIAREADSDATFTSAAVLERDDDCGLVSALVDYDAKTWSLERRCFSKEGFSIQKSRSGAGGVERGYPFNLAVDPRDPDRATVVLPGGANAWFVYDCPLGSDADCGTAKLEGVPLHAGLLIRGGGLQVFQLKAAIGVVSGTEDLRQLWTGRYPRSGGAPRWTKSWPAPTINLKGYSLLAGALAGPDADGDSDGVWLVSIHWAFDGDWTPGNAPTEHRRLLEVSRSSYRELFDAR